VPAGDREHYPDLAGSSGGTSTPALARCFRATAVVKGVATDVRAPQGDRREFGNAIVTRLPVCRAFRRLLPGGGSVGAEHSSASAVEVVLDPVPARCA